jgi:hypothetical protein
MSHMQLFVLKIPISGLADRVFGAQKGIPVSPLRG